MQYVVSAYFVLLMIVWHNDFWQAYIKVRKANLFHINLEVLEALADTGRLALQ